MTYCEGLINFIEEFNSSILVYKALTEGISSLLCGFDIYVLL